jgi:N-acetyltransferase
MSITIEPGRIIGRHVVLEPIALAHAPGLFAIGQEAADWQYMPRGCFTSLADATDWVEQALTLLQRREHITYTLLDPVSNAVLGSSRYLNIRAKDHGLEIGWTWLGKAAQRTAVNTEAKYLLLQQAFEAIGTYRVELKTDARNLRSQAAIERIGAVKEGVFRKHMIAQQGFVRDSVYYSILDTEWPAIKQRLLRMLQP